MSIIELMLHARLVKDALSPTLTAAGFLIIEDQGQDNCHKTVVIDFEYFRNPEVVRLLQSPGVKIVVLASEADL